MHTTTLKQLLTSLFSLFLIASISLSCVQMASAQTKSDDDKLLEAARDGHSLVLSTLLKSGANPLWRDKDGYDAFDYAIERHQFAISQLLLMHALELTISNDAERQYVNAYLHHTTLPSGVVTMPVKIALMRVFANQGKTQEVFQLIQTGLPLDAGAASGYTALSLAVRWQHRELVTRLLDAGANPNQHTHSCYQTTPLMEASRDGNVAIAKQLISKGAKVNAPDKFGDHALNWAAFFGHQEFSELLLAHGADLTRTGQTDDNALDVAIRQGHSKLIVLLKNAGAKPHLKKAQ
jgi:ankyrin repeat protein